jgi:D-glycero-D-manno-heptose 1,7-bisphosphate phosphatase
MTRLALLDRDGVINEVRADGVKTPDELVLLSGSAAAVARLNAAGIKVVLVSDEPAVGRGRLSMQALERLHAELRGRLAREGAHLDAVLVCTDSPDRASPRRKPGPGMLMEALRQFRAAADGTPMIGDDLDDLRAAKAAGCRRVLVRTGRGAAVQAAGVPADLLPVAVHADLAAAVEAYLKDELW